MSETTNKQAVKAKTKSLFSFLKFDQLIQIKKDQLAIKPLQDKICSFNNAVEELRESIKFPRNIQSYTK